MENNEKHIVLFDGVCNLCNGTVQFILRFDKHKKIATLTTWYSFIIGTIILVLFLTTNLGVFIGIGLSYILIAFTINSGVLIGLLIHSFVSKINKVTLFSYSLIPLINIPLALLYCMIAVFNIK